MSSKVLNFQNVSVVYPNGNRALDAVSFSIAPGECFAIVGESGCGKSTLARAALGLLPPGTKIDGSILVNDIEVIGARQNLLRRLRGLVVGFVAQDPFTALNPLAPVGDFVREAWRVHSIVPPEDHIKNSLENLGIQNARSKIKLLPHQWSGGMLQRAGIAAARAHAPKLIIADEPTSALDADLNQAVLEALRQTRTAVLLISHDLRLVEKYADRIAVMKDGAIIETGATREIFESPAHDYTKRLLAITAASRPKSAVKEILPDNSKIILETKNLSFSYGQNGIIKNLDLQIRAGEIIGISGASGGGKSTLLRLLMALEKPDGGEIYLGGELASTGESRKLSSTNTRNGFVIPIFQDAFSSLNSRWSIRRIVAEPLTARHRRSPKFSKQQRDQIALQKLREVGLENINPESAPTRLSTGQCQRVAIARALTAQAKLIAADEPTASLDVLSGERVMQLFAEAAAARDGTAIIIVSHNKELLNRWCHRIFSIRDGTLTQTAGYSAAPPAPT